MNKELIKSRFTKALQQYNALAVVQADIARCLAGSMASHLASHEVARGCEIGAGSGFLTRNLIPLYPNAHWVINDITAESELFMPEDFYSHGEFICADGEYLEITPDSLDLIASASTIQWFSNIDDFITRITPALRKNGVVCLSTFGPSNFREITQITGESLTYPTLEQLILCFTNLGYDIIESREWTEQLVFDTPIDALRHIKATGVNSLSSKRWTHRDLISFSENYISSFSPITLTFAPILIIARRPR